MYHISAIKLLSITNKVTLQTIVTLPVMWLCIGTSVILVSTTSNSCFKALAHCLSFPSKSCDFYRFCFVCYLHCDFQNCMENIKNANWIVWIVSLFFFHPYTFLYHINVFIVMLFSILVPDTAGVPVEDRWRPCASENERQHLHCQSPHRVSLCRKGWQRSGDTFNIHLRDAYCTLRFSIVDKRIYISSYSF